MGCHGVDGEIRNSKCAILEHFSLHCYGRFTPKSENTEVFKHFEIQIINVYGPTMCME